MEEEVSVLYKTEAPAHIQPYLITETERPLRSFS